MAYNFLIIDDSAIVRKVFRRSLEMTDLEINQLYEAGNGKEGLDIVRSEWIDLIFLDINMPVMNGIEFIEQLRKDDSVGETPVIVVSTEGSQDRILLFEEQGVSRYLRKPVSPEDLIDAVQVTLGK